MTSKAESLKAAALEKGDHSKLCTKNVQGQMFLVLAPGLESAKSDDSSTDTEPESDVEIEVDEPFDASASLTLGLLDQNGREVKQVYVKGRTPCSKGSFDELWEKRVIKSHPLSNDLGKISSISVANMPKAPDGCKWLPVTSYKENPFPSAPRNTYIIRTSLPLSSLNLKSLIHSGSFPGLISNNIAGKPFDFPAPATVTPSQSVTTVYPPFSCHHKTPVLSSSTPSNKLVSQKPLTATTNSITSPISCVNKCHSSLSNRVLVQKPSTTSLNTNNSVIIPSTYSDTTKRIECVTAPTVGRPSVQSFATASTNVIKPVLDTGQSIHKVQISNPNLLGPVITSGLSQGLTSNVQSQVISGSQIGRLVNISLANNPNSPQMTPCVLFSTAQTSTSSSTLSTTKVPIVHTGLLPQKIASGINRDTNQTTTSTSDLAPSNNTAVHKILQASPNISSSITNSLVCINQTDSNSSGTAFPLPSTSIPSSSSPSPCTFVSIPDLNSAGSVLVKIVPVPTSTATSTSKITFTLPAGIPSVAGTMDSTSCSPSLAGNIDQHLTLSAEAGSELKQKQLYHYLKMDASTPVSAADLEESTTDLSINKSPSVNNVKSIRLLTPSGACNLVSSTQTSSDSISTISNSLNEDENANLQNDDDDDPVIKISDDSDAQQNSVVILPTSDTASPVRTTSPSVHMKAPQKDHGKTSSVKVDDTVQFLKLGSLANNETNSAKTDVANSDAKSVAGRVEEKENDSDAIDNFSRQKINFLKDIDLDTSDLNLISKAHKIKQEINDGSYPDDPPKSNLTSAALNLNNKINNTNLIKVPTSLMNGRHVITLPSQVPASSVVSGVTLPNRASSNTQFVTMISKPTAQVLDNKLPGTTQLVSLSNKTQNVPQRVVTLPNPTPSATQPVAIASKTPTAQQLISLLGQTVSPTPNVPQLVTLPNQTPPATQPVTIASKTQLVTLPNQTPPATQPVTIASKTQLVTLRNQTPSATQPVTIASKTQLVTLPNQTPPATQPVTIASKTPLVTLPNQTPSATQPVTIASKTQLVTLPNQTPSATQPVTIASKTPLAPQLISLLGQTLTTTNVVKLTSPMSSGTQLTTLPAQIPKGSQLFKLSAPLPAGTQLSSLGTQIPKGAHFIKLAAGTKLSNTQFVTVASPAQKCSRHVTLTTQALTSPKVATVPAATHIVPMTTKPQLVPITTQTASPIVSLTNQAGGTTRVTSLVNPGTVNPQFVKLPNLTSGQLVKLSNQGLTGSHVIKLPSVNNSENKIAGQILSGTQFVRLNMVNSTTAPYLKFMPVANSANSSRMPLKQPTKVIVKTMPINNNGQTSMNASNGKGAIPTINAQMFQKLQTGEPRTVVVNSKGSLSSAAQTTTTTSIGNLQRQSLLVPKHEEKKVSSNSVLQAALRSPAKFSSSLSEINAGEDIPMTLKIDSIFSLQDDKNQGLDYWKSPQKDKSTKDNPSETRSGDMVNLATPNSSCKAGRATTPLQYKVVARKDAASETEDLDKVVFSKDAASETEDLDMKLGTSPQPKPIVYARLNPPKTHASSSSSWKKQYRVQDHTNHFSTPLKKQVKVCRPFRRWVSIIKKAKRPQAYKIKGRLHVDKVKQKRYAFLQPRVMLPQLYIPSRMKSLHVQRLPAETVKSLLCEDDCVDRVRVTPSYTPPIRITSSSPQTTKTYMVMNVNNKPVLKPYSPNSMPSTSVTKLPIRIMSAINVGVSPTVNQNREVSKPSANNDDVLSCLELACGIIQDDTVKKRVRRKSDDNDWIDDLEQQYRSMKKTKKVSSSDFTDLVRLNTFM